ncbi:ATP-binding cassette transporter snq2 [Rhodosporidiobolus nylandii]
MALPITVPPTLLNTIAGRSSTLDVTAGRINYTSAGSSLAPLRAKRHIGYVRQTDDLLPYLTARETLAFAASLRLPSSVSPATRAVIVENTLAELGLTEVADVYVGGGLAKKGLSGGEKRRLSIGCVLVTDPAILILDEPTTGLDAFVAFHLLQTLQRLAQRGRTVLLSLHQPRSDAFEVFDKLVVLSRGSLVFSGPRRDLVPYFSTLSHPPPLHSNPLDHVIDISSVDSRTDEAEKASAEQVGGLVRAWTEHALRMGARAKGAEEREARGVEGKGAESATSPLSAISHDLEKNGSGQTAPASSAANEQHCASWLRQTQVLTRRNVLNVSRNFGLTAGLGIQAIVVGIVLGLVFLVPPESPAGVQSRKTVIYFSGPGLFYLVIIEAVLLLCNDLVLFDREKNDDGLFDTVPWVLSTVLAYLPANIVFPTIYAIIVYFMAGFRQDELAKNLLSFIAQCIMQQQASWGYALFAASINRSFAQASLLANGFSIPFYLGAGYLLPHLPGYIRWIQYLSPYFYGFHWIARLQFTDRAFSCEGITGVSLNQCEGTSILTGMRFNLATPLWVYPVGLLGFILVTYALGTLLLATHHPGGVKHASAKEAAPQRAKSVELNPDEKLKAPEHVDVTVKNFNVTVVSRSLAKRKPTEKVLLDDVNASFPAGAVTAIMGPSGAGKSTLLQALAGRLDSLAGFSSTGGVTLNGHKLDSTTAALIGYVEQEDNHHLPALTVRETLRYAARLRLKGCSSGACDGRAEEVLRQVGLKACADNMVGGELLKGISGGEKRRLSLAIELLSDPPILLADEPTSGLDSFTALSVMELLRDLASAGRTVILSVHQPRSAIWDMLDHVVLLAKGGKTAYTGSADRVVEALEAAGRSPPENYNIADYIIDVVSEGQRLPAVDAVSFKNRAPPCSTDARPELATLNIRAAKLASRPTPFLQAFPVVLSRSFRNLRRQQDIFVARIANPPFLALLFWLFFLRLGYGPSSAQARVGLLQETTALPFVGMLSCISIFPFEKNLFFYERRSSARHSSATFIVAYTVQESVVSLISSLLWSIVFVYGMNLRHSARIFVEFWISSFALISAGESIGIAFTAWTQNGGLAVALVSAGLTLLAQLNGIISVTLDRWLKVIGWVSPMKPQAYNTGKEQLNKSDPPAGLRFDCSDADIVSGACETGKFMGILLALVVIWRLLAYAAVQLRVARL